MIKIAMVDYYSNTPEEIAKFCEGLLEILGEHEKEIFRCTCDDGDVPGGYTESDTNAFIHHSDCPEGNFYTYEVLLRGLARYFKEDVHET